jgi:Fe-S-cluster containining protein
VKRKKRLPVVAEFPPMRCDDGCGDCCGPAPVTQAEFDRIVDYITQHKIVPREQGQTCPLYLDGRCSVYEVRPFACRAFGHVAGMACSRGYNTNISEARLHTMLVANGEPTTITHDLLAIRNPAMSFKGVLDRIVQG